MLSRVSTVVIPPPPLRLYRGPVVCWPIALLFATFAAWGFATGRGRLSPGFFWFMAAAAALMFVIAVGTTIRRKQLQLTMSLSERGVTLVSGNREHALAYRDVDSLTVVESDRYDDHRNVIALNRTITLQAEGTRAKASYVAESDDPLEALLQQLVERMARERRNRAGDGWSIEQEMLITGRERFPLSMISAAGVFDREVRIWRRGSSTPILTVPLSSRNARLLLHLAGEAQSAASAHAPAANDDLQLFTRRTSLASVLFQSALGGVAVWLAQYAVEVKAPAFAAMADKLAIAAALLLAIAALHRLTRTYEFHQHAVTRRTWFGSRTFRYDDAAALTWNERSTYLNHAIYLGTKMKVTLASADGKPFAIDLHRFRAEDEELVTLRRLLAGKIALRLHQEWKHGDRIVWTSGAAFTTIGLEVKTGLLGNTRELLSYGQPLHALFSDGYLVLYRDHWTQPLATLEIAQANFYPGLALFERLTPLTFHAK